MYTLYIANKVYSSWSLRPWILMRELGIPFEEKLVRFSGPDNWESFRAFSPAGKVPCLHDGDAVVWDSMGITEFVADSHPYVWPADKYARAWARCAAAEMHSGFTALRNTCPMHVALRIRLNEITPELQKDINRLNELWAEGLNRFGGPFLAGDKFTAVDAFFAPVVFRIQSYHVPVNEIAQTYVKHILGLAGMQEWQAAALEETERDASHEDESKAAGTLLEDKRN